MCAVASEMLFEARAWNVDGDINADNRRSLCYIIASLNSGYYEILDIEILKDIGIKWFHLCHLYTYQLILVFLQDSILHLLYAYALSTFLYLKVLMIMYVLFR